MKKILVIAVAAVSLVAMQAYANVQINMFAGFLYDHAGAPVSSLPTAATGLILEDMGGLGVPSGQLAPGTSTTVGSVIGGNWLILANADFSVNGTDGLLSLGTGGINTGSFGGGVLLSGKVIDLMWLPTTPSISPVMLAGFYGAITEPTDLSGGDAWVVPPDGSSFSPNLFTTLTGGGDIPDANTIANGQIGTIPEPSSIALVVLGMLGAVGIIRRRR